MLGGVLVGIQFIKLKFIEILSTEIFISYSFCIFA